MPKSKSVKTTTMHGKGQNANTKNNKKKGSDTNIPSKKGVKKTGKFYLQAFEAAKKKVFGIGAKK